MGGNAHPGGDREQGGYFLCAARVPLLVNSLRNKPSPNTQQVV